MEKTYQITKQNQFVMLRRLLLDGLLILVGFVAVVGFYPDHPLMAAAIFLTIYLIYDLIPTSLLHWQYYRRNQDTRVIFDKVAGSIMVLDNGLSHTFDFEKILSVRISLGWYLFRGDKIGMVAWNLYHYAVLETNEGDRLVITCLLISNLEPFLKDMGLPVIKERRVFPFIYDFDRADVRNQSANELARRGRRITSGSS